MLQGRAGGQVHLGGEGLVVGDGGRRRGELWPVGHIHIPGLEPLDQPLDAAAPGLPPTRIARPVGSTHMLEWYWWAAEVGSPPGG